jgi:hypothetical protein
MAKEYKTLTFIDSPTGRQRMTEVINQLSNEDWTIKSKETATQDRSHGSTCCLGCILLPIRSKKQSLITVIMERDADPNRKTTEHKEYNNLITNSDTKPWYKKWWIVLIIAFFGMCFLAALIGRISNHTSTQTQTNIEQVIQEGSTGIVYKVVEEWDLPDGKGNVIVIDPKYDNDKDLQSLGVQLNEENKDNYFVNIEVFTDNEAAAHRKVSFCAPGVDPKIREYNVYFAALYKKGHGGADYAVWGSRVCGVEAENKVTEFPN